MLIADRGGIYGQKKRGLKLQLLLLSRLSALLGKKHAVLDGLLSFQRPLGDLQHFLLLVVFSLSLFLLLLVILRHPLLSTTNNRLLKTICLGTKHKFDNLPQRICAQHITTECK